MTKIMLRYKVPPEFVCRVSGNSKCISYPNPMEVAVSEETFIVRFRLPLHTFIEWLLGKYRLVPMLIHPNA